MLRGQRLEYKTLPFAVKATSGDGGEFEGLASVFYCIDDSWWNDIVAPGAFKEDLPEFLDVGFVSGLNHDWDCPIGKPLSAEETAVGLYVKGSISDTAAGRDARTLLKDGVVKRMSIGFRTLGREYLETAEEVMAWWQKHGYTPTAEDIAKSQYGARVLTRIRLYEFGPVAVPANKRAVITAVKGGGDPEQAPRSLAEHSAAALAAVEEWYERVEGVARLRAEEGRSLSPEHLAGLKRMRAGLDQWIVRVARDPTEGKEGARQPGEPGPCAEARQLAAQMAAIEARLLGVRG